MLSFDVLAARLKDKYTHPEFDLSDMWLIEPGVDAGIVWDAQHQLEVEFPREMSQLLMRFDFSRLSLCNLHFGYGDDLEKLVATNLGLPFPWWIGKKRPENRLFIAMTDGHSILLSINDGRIIAIEEGFNTERLIAKNFEELVRVAATLALGNSTQERNDVVESLSLDRFWKQLAAGTA